MLKTNNKQNNQNPYRLIDWLIIVDFCHVNNISDIYTMTRTNNTFKYTVPKCCNYWNVIKLYCTCKHRSILRTPSTREHLRCTLGMNCSFHSHSYLMTPLNGSFLSVAWKRWHIFITRDSREIQCKLHQTFN